MSRSKATKADAKVEGEVSPAEANDTGNQTTAVENEGAGDAGEVSASGVSETTELEPLSREDQQAAIAGSMGGPDNYPYQDRTAVPLHERNLSAVNNPLTEASQAELNPAFTAKADDGGPTTTEGEGIGTEPNVHDQMLAAAENSGQEGAVEQTQAQIDAGAEQQIDAQAVTDAAQQAAPDGIDGATGQPEGQATVPGAPSGMEPDSKSDEDDVPVAGAQES